MTGFYFRAAPRADEVAHQDGCRVQNLLLGPRMRRERLGKPFVDRPGQKQGAMIKLKRVYDPVSRADGRRFLVERLWPRGVSKDRLRQTTWLKEVGPSTELRRWFAHDPAKWSRFRSRYFRELEAQPEVWRPLLAAARRGTVTLVYSSHDEVHNNAVALKDYLDGKRRRPSVQMSG